MAADSVAAARRDSAAALARRDSLAREAARRDSVARVERERARADSVRAQIQRDLAAPVSATPLPVEDGSLAEPIHFDYDRADLTGEALRRLDAKLALLRANPRLEVLIEGHCDERGSDEYNLALGNRRAAAARQYLVQHGVSEHRLAMTSFGEERPADPGHTEEAWARNRRAEFRVVGGRR
jgi:peptidoglycan-associated lipoprotein